MAYTFDTSLRIPVTAATSSTTNPLAANYTCGAGVTVLCLMLAYAGGAVDRSGGAPTYNGVAMTQAGVVRRAAASPEGSSEMWYLLDPPTGAALSISVPNDGEFAMVAIAASGISANGYRSVLDSIGGGVGTTTNPGATLTTIAASTIEFANVFTGALTWAPSARDGTQLYDDDNGSWGEGAQYLINSTSGVHFMGWTFGTIDDWGVCVAAFSEVQARGFLQPMSIYG